MSIREIARQSPNGLIGRALSFATLAHKGQKRITNEPYINHSIATAETLSTWNLDEATIAAGLLHDVAEDTPRKLDEIASRFGDEIAFLVQGVTKLGRVKYRGATGKAENLRKMILAISQDLRVVFIKLADRLHNMKTIHALPPAKQKRIALETDEIYASLASRLGMHEISGELHDLAFPILFPAECRWLKANVADAYTVRRKYLETLEPRLREILRKAGLKPAAIDYRAKRSYSLYRKLLRYDMNFEKIYDLVALRVLFESVEDCYAALGAIHQEWRPLPGRIKDYIAMPKENNYRSLHTTIVGPDGRSVEIQIRTRAMHEENEYGIASHWLYKERKRGWGKKISETVNWIQQLRKWQESHSNANENAEDFLKSMKFEFFKDRIFAITPAGDVIDLPNGATPVDFAYHIHSEIGNACVGAKVNGQFVPLNHTLISGDVVEILTQKNKRPSGDWLKFAKTNIAREHILSALKTKTGSLQRTRVPTKTELRIVVHDRVGLLKDITSVIARSHMNIVGLKVDHSAGSNYPIDKIVVSTADRKKIEKLILKLKQIKEVREVGFRML